MSNTVVIGMQWGDEGKGKVVDLLGPAFDVVVRFQGGNNAGHTVKFGDRHYALHFIPSGILHPDKQCVLGNGMVIEPEAMLAELAGLAETGVEPAGRLFLSNRAQIILPVHLELDRVREEERAGGKIGTTAKGIGPAYEAKARRTGLRAGDLTAGDMEERVRRELASVAPELERLGGETPDAATLVERCRQWAERLAPMLADTEYLLNHWIDEGRRVLFEGAQGTMLDLDHGTYPFVTSSSASAGGAATGSGVPPGRIDGVLGVLKAYTTRVGSGPFPTELTSETGDYLRERGNEFGTTTGRPRRCGWFDAVVARHTRMINGVDAIALTKLDVLDELDELKVCVGYRIGDRLVRDLPSALDEVAAAQPIYETVPGWGESTVGTLEFDDLPLAAREYVALLEQEVGVPVAILSTGARREETILRETPELERLTGGALGAVRLERGG